MGTLLVGHIADSLDQCHASLASSNDILVFMTRRTVTSGKNAGQIGLGLRIDDNVLMLIQRNKTTHKLCVGNTSDLNKDSLDYDHAIFSILVDLESCNQRITKYFFCFCLICNLNFRIFLHPLYQITLGSE